MLALSDAVALSLWPKARNRRLTEFLRAHIDVDGRPRDSVPAANSLPVDPPVDASGLPECTLPAALEYAGTPGAGPLVAKLRDDAARAIQRAAAAGITPIPLGDQRYPPLLALIHDPPVVLWVKGDPRVLRRPAVALVGSRGASPYGLEAATHLAGALAPAGATIVSGLARGVDSAAHRGALQAGGLTIAVLGSGPDTIYPPEHAALAESIAEAGAVVAELAPGTPPRALHFPARNRIISGLSLAVVVVEAAEQSGSLITAEFASDQGRTVMAVPGSIFSGRHGGCHALIRDGAAIVCSADDVAWELSTNRLRALLGPSSEQALPRNPLLERMVAGEAYDIDRLARESGLSPAVLLSRLLELELQGVVRRADGSRFMRVSRTC
jgi:DNA processing protein